MQFKSDCEAWEFLKSRGFTEDHFIIDLSRHSILTYDESVALEYLCIEWDWDWTRGE